MANMYPSFGPKSNDSKTAEPLVYKLLNDHLDNSFYVIHSIPWLSSFVNDLPGEKSPIGEVDFLILNETLGALAIEVKGGQLKHDSDGFYYSRGSGLEISRIDPVSQLNRGIFAIQKWLFGNNLKIKIGKCFYFPESEAPLNSLPAGYFNVNFNEPISLVIDINDNNILETKIKSLMAFYKKQLRCDDLSVFQIKKLIDMIVPRADYSPCWLSRIENDSFLWLRLTDEQSDCINDALNVNRLIVNGWPGSGKTIVAIETARRLSLKESKTLIITYNTLLSEKLSEELGQHEFCSVLNLHKLCGKAADFNDSNCIFDNKWFRSGAYEELEKAIDKGFLRNYENLIVDEGQVINAKVWGSLYKEFKKKKIIVMCDTFQALEFEKPVSLEWLENLLQVSAFTLTNSLRLPKTVCDRLKVFNKPSYSVTNPRSREEDTLVELIVQDQKISLSELLDQFISDNVPLSYITVLKPAYMFIPTNIVPQGTEVETIGRFRGLEKPIIIILASPQMTDVEFFCAYSRATSRCIVILEAYNVQRGFYSSLGAFIYDRNKSKVDYESEKSLTKNFIKSIDVALVAVCKSIPIFWSERWKVYILKTDDEVLKGIFIAYFSTIATPPIFTWGEDSRKTLDLIEEDDNSFFDQFRQGFYEIRGCAQCGVKTPHSLSGFNNEGCFVCKKLHENREYDFEEKIKNIDAILEFPESYTVDQKKNIHPAIYSIGAFSKIRTRLGDVPTSKLLSDFSKPISIVAAVLIIVYLYRTSVKGHDTVKVGDVANGISNWNFKIKELPQDSWKAHVNDAFTKLEKHGVVVTVDKGKRRINASAFLN